jgi:hypothetical protein
MLHLSINELYEQLSEDLEFIEKSEVEPINRMVNTVATVRAALNELKSLIVKYPFASTAEEIDFFKHVKPKFYSKLIYYVETYKISSAKPVGTADTIREYYEKELTFVERFFRQNQFMYEYYRQHMVELDSLYFVRGVEIKAILLPEIPDLEPEFSTRSDYLFSKFIAYELLQKYLLTELSKLNPSVTIVNEEKKDLPELKWTGDKVNLVEVIYGIYFTGQLNHGNADLSVIIKFMEKSLNIDLSRSYRDFIDIRNRKRSSPTRYIDEMRESIHKRVDEDLALKKPCRAGFNSDLK